MSKFVNIGIECNRPTDLPHNWNYIGYDEINYTYVPEGQELLAKFGHMQEKPYFVRAHHLLCTGNGHASYKWGSTNAYLEDENGVPIYNWAFVDLTFDTMLKHGTKPFVELGFMPQHLADPARYDLTQDNWTNQNYRLYGFAVPPKDYQKWYDLIFALVQHCAERYGMDEISGWYWELWNEPDLDIYWKGSVEEFNRLYDFTAAAVKAACPTARVGGPGTTNPVEGRRAAQFLDEFLNHCVNGTNAYTGLNGTPLDFLSFHVKGGGYRADPLHRPQNPPSVKQILAHTQHGHEIINRYPTLNGLECILSEIDPDGWAAGGAWDNANLNFRNTEYYPSFVAAAFDKVSRYGREQAWDVRLLSWAFMFVGERCFEGTRTFSTQGIDKAILNLFRMYALMGTQEIGFSSSGVQDPLQYADLNGMNEAPDISGFATLTEGKSIEILVYNHHDDWNLTGETDVRLAIDYLHMGLSTSDTTPLTVTHYRIDAEHSNAYAEWVRQGKPMYPTPEQRAAIKARENLELVEPPRTVTPSHGKVTLDFTLPVHGISLVVISR